MDKLKYIRVQKQDGTYSDDIPIAPDAENVLMRNGNTLQDTIGNLDINSADDITTQLSRKIDTENAVPVITSTTTSWLNTNVTPVGSAVVVDSSLSTNGAAADAKKTGDEIADLKEDLNDNTKNLELSLNDGLMIVKGSFARGAITSSGALNPYFKYRVSSENIVSYDRDIHITVSQDYMVNIYLFNSDDEYTGETITLRSIKTHTLPANQKFKIMICRMTEDVSEIADIHEFIFQILINTVVNEDIIKQVNDYIDEVNLRTLQNYNDISDKIGDIVNYVPYERQLFDCTKMLYPQRNLSIANDAIINNSGRRMYVVKILGISGDTYSFNFLPKNGTDVPSTYDYCNFFASNDLPVEGGTILQSGSANSTAKRGLITLNQNTSYLLIVVGSNTPSYPEDIYTESCNTLMEHIVLRKGSYDNTFYNYDEYPVYSVVPYEQGVSNQGKILKVNSNGVLELQKESSGTDEQRVIEIIGENAVLKNQGSSNQGKILGVGQDGKVGLYESEESVTQSPASRLNVNKTVYIGEELLTEASVNLGNGWSGSLANGFTHTSGSNDVLSFNIQTDNGSDYIVTLGTSSPSLIADKITLAIGNSAKVDPYNGNTVMYVGIKSNSGHLTIYPEFTYTGSLTVSLKKIVDSGTELTTSPYNINFGQTTGDITGFWNVALSDDALCNNENGSRNIAIGRQSMYMFKSGTRNVCVGTFSMPFVQEGDRNVAIGADTIYGGASGYKKAYDNIAIGKAAVHAGSEIKKNIGIGSGALAGGTETASENVCIGYRAGFYGDTGNTHVGSSSGYYTKGNNNVSVGCNAGSDLYNTGDRNICIGYNSGIKSPDSSSSNIVTINNSIAIGDGVKATKSNQAVFGNQYQEIVLVGKKLTFNNDGTVTWSELT